MARNFSQDNFTHNSLSQTTVRDSNIRPRTEFMVKTALLIAITIIMGTTPLGTIRTPFLSVSLVTIPVAIAAMTLGPSGAAIVGTVFGLTSFLNALTGTSGLLSTLFTIRPIGPAGVFVTAVIARILDGLCTGLIFTVLKNKLHLGSIACYLTGLAAPLFNTLFFMSSLIIFFYQSDYIQNMAEGLNSHNPMTFVIALVGVQGLIEAVTGCVLSGSIGLLLTKALRRK